MADSRTPPWGLLAEYDTPAAVYHACERVRDAGYSRWDSYTPFPVHGLDKAMGIKRSRLPFFVLFGALVGGGGGMLLQWWTSAVDYPWVVSGKPFFSWPAFMPVTFELAVLFGALGAVLGMLGLNRLPQYHHALFHSKRFERVSDDRFFVAIEASDPKFDLDRTAALLRDTGATHVEQVREEP
jgi:hypothetical protein